jgi:hypothetical protein
VTGFHVASVHSIALRSLTLDSLLLEAACLQDALLVGWSLDRRPIDHQPDVPWGLEVGVRDLRTFVVVAPELRISRSELSCDFFVL